MTPHLRPGNIAKTDFLRLAKAILTLLASTTQQTPIAQPAILSNQHADIGVGYEDGRLIPHVHDESSDMEHKPSEALLQVGIESATVVPADARFSFLGTPGSRIFLLPQNQHPNLLFLGLAAEEIEKGVFDGDAIRLNLRSVKGPGDFYLYRTSGILGNPVITFNSSDGLSSEDSVLVPAGSHSDFNWAFTQPGDYSISIDATGILAADRSAISSGNVDFHFQVIPEPDSWLLFMLGACTTPGVRSRIRKGFLMGMRKEGAK